MSPRSIVACSLLALLLGACGSAGPQTPGWSQGMGTWFSNDSLRANEAGARQWTARDADVLMRRMGYADAVAVGTLRLVSRYAPSDSPRQVSLAFRPDELVYGSLAGDLDEAGEVTLTLDPSSTEFRFALAAEAELPGKQYLLFLKRGASDGLHWGCYRPTPALLAEVRTKYAWLKRQKQASAASHVGESEPLRSDGESLGDALSSGL